MFHSFFQSPSKVHLFILLFTFFQFYSVVSRNSKVYFSASFLFCWPSLRLVIWPRLGDPFISQNPRGVCASHSPGLILGCAYTIGSYGQISVSCTISSGSPFSPSRVQFYTLFMQICCSHLLCDWSFCLYGHITYIYCFVVNSCFDIVLMALLKRFCFSLKVSFFLSTSTFFRVRYHLFVT